MRTIVATIKEEHLTNIRSGKKLYEMRKTCPKETPFRVLCCQSKSGGQILAEFVVQEPIRALPRIWPALVRKACIPMSVADAYAGDGQVWFWDVNDMIDYCTTPGHRPRNISEYGLTRPPQSWCYVEEAENMRYCGDCTHLDVCKYSDAGDGRCQRPQHFQDKRSIPAEVKVSKNTMKALARMGKRAHGGAQGGRRW